MPTLSGKVAGIDRTFDLMAKEPLFLVRRMLQGNSKAIEALLGGQLFSEVVSKTFVGAHVVRRQSPGPGRAPVPMTLRRGPHRQRTTERGRQAMIASNCPRVR
jgi:hypothetical protein